VDILVLLLFQRFCAFVAYKCLSMKIALSVWLMNVFFQILWSTYGNGKLLYLLNILHLQSGAATKPMVDFRNATT